MMSEPKVFFLVPLSSNDTFPPGHLGAGEQQSYVEIPRAWFVFAWFRSRIHKSTFPIERWPRISGLLAFDEMKQWSICMFYQGTIAAQFNCEGTTLSGVEFELSGSGYRVSLVKRRFVSGEFTSYFGQMTSPQVQTPDESTDFIKTKLPLVRT